MKDRDVDDLYHLGSTISGHLADISDSLRSIAESLRQISSGEDQVPHNEHQHVYDGDDTRCTACGYSPFLGHPPGPADHPSNHYFYTQASPAYAPAEDKGQPCSYTRLCGCICQHHHHRTSGSITINAVHDACPFHGVADG